MKFKKYAENYEPEKDLKTVRNQALNYLHAHYEDSFTVQSATTINWAENYETLIVSSEKYSGKTFFVTFVIKDNDYLRYIGETTKDLVYVTNKKGTFSEFQTKRFNISSRENGESLNELNEDVKSLTISNDLLISIYEEIKELEQFDGKSVLAEEIYNKKAKKYNLK